MVPSRLADALEIAGVGAWEWDLLTDAVTWSPNLHGVLLVPDIPDPRPGDYLDAVHDEDRDPVEAAIARSLRRGVPFALDHRIRTRDGSTRWLHARGRVVLGPDGPVGIRGTVQDVTHRKEAEEAQERFLATAAHDLKGPMTVIRGFAHVLAERHDVLPREDVTAYLGIIRDQGERALRVAGDLFELARLERAGLEADLELVGLAGVLGAAAGRVTRPAASTVLIDVPDDLVVSASASHLERVVAILLANAYGHGGPAVTVSARAEAGDVLLTVTDDGGGVDDALVPTLFDPHSKGLRLSLARALARAMGGDLRYEPAEPQGCSFVLVLRT